MNERDYNILSICKQITHFSDLCYKLDSWGEQSVVWQQASNLVHKGLLEHYADSQTMGRFSLSDEGKKEVGFYEMAFGLTPTVR